MPGPCCGTPVAKIIKVGNVNVGIVGLENALQNAYLSGVKDEGELAKDLLSWIKDFGNYVAPSREEDYKQALLAEYRKFCAAIERESKTQEQTAGSKATEEEKKKRL